MIDHQNMNIIIIQLIIQHNYIIIHLFQHKNIYLLKNINKFINKLIIIVIVIVIYLTIIKIPNRNRNRNKNRNKNKNKKD
jgi:hypothetical protein